MTSCLPGVMHDGAFYTNLPSVRLSRGSSLPVAVSKVAVSTSLGARGKVQLFDVVVVVL